MSSFKGLLFSIALVGLSGAALAQPKADGGAGPTSGSASANDAGSGPTTGAKPETTVSDSGGSTENSAGVTPGPKSTGGSQPTTPATAEKK
jgi:hypothetical protein